MPQPPEWLELWASVVMGVELSVGAWWVYCLVILEGH